MVGSFRSVDSDIVARRDCRGHPARPRIRLRAVTQRREDHDWPVRGFGGLLIVSGSSRRVSLVYLASISSIACWCSSISLISSPDLSICHIGSLSMRVIMLGLVSVRMVSIIC